MAKSLLVLLIAFCVWLPIDLDYSSEGDERDRGYSLEKMMKWSPFKAKMLIEDFEIAASDNRATNLNGLNAVQIHKVAVKNRVLSYGQRVRMMKSTLDSAKLSGQNEVQLMLGNPKSIMTLVELENELHSMEVALTTLKKEADSFWWS